jgi:hypothetical protein
MATKKPTSINRPPAAKSPFGDREKTAAEKLRADIQVQAQARFVASAAIDAAVAMREAGIQKPLTQTQIKAKGKIKPESVKDELLLRIAEGESVFTICQDTHMPARSVIYKWIREHAQFKQEYESALDQRADKYVEQIADLSRHMQDRAAMGASNEEVTALKAHINSLQWIAARLNPKKYGDKQQLDIDQKVTLDDKQLDQRLAALVAKAKAKPKAAE